MGEENSLLLLLLGFSFDNCVFMFCNNSHPSAAAAATIIVVIVTDTAAFSD